MIPAEAATTVAQGSLLLAVPIAMAAGLVSFLSPCVLPLVPGYLSYITGLTGAELGMTAPAKAPVASRSTSIAAAGESAGDSAGDSAVDTAVSTSVAVETAPTRSVRSSRVLVGTLGFIAGFTVVFMSYGALFGALGDLLLEYQDIITRVMGVLVIILGLGFMGWLPGLQREYRIHRAPVIGLWGAPLLGALFGIGWTPCIGPTLAAVQSLAFTEASAARGALLSLAYCVGLGVPFIVIGLAFRRLAGTLGWVKSHYALVMRVGGGLLIVIGLLLVTGIWNDLTIEMRTWTGSFEVPL